MRFILQLSRHENVVRSAPNLSNASVSSRFGHILNLWHEQEREVRDWTVFIFLHQSWPQNCRPKIDGNLSVLFDLHYLEVEVTSRGKGKKIRNRKIKPKKRKIELKSWWTNLIFLKYSVWLTEQKKFCGFSFGFSSAIWDSVNHMVNRNQSLRHFYLKKTKFNIGQV